MPGNMSYFNVSIHNCSCNMYTFRVPSNFSKKSQACPDSAFNHCPDLRKSGRFYFIVQDKRGSVIKQDHLSMVQGLSTGYPHSCNARAPVRTGPYPAVLARPQTLSVVNLGTCIDMLNFRILSHIMGTWNLQFTKQKSQRRQQVNATLQRSFTLTHHVS